MLMVRVSTNVSKHFSDALDTMIEKNKCFLPVYVVNVLPQIMGH